MPKTVKQTSISPMSGAQLLDLIYGQVYAPKDFAPCVCGAKYKQTHLKIQWYCGAEGCRDECDDWLIFDDDEDKILVDASSPIVKMRGVTYEFFAHRWWVHGRHGRSYIMELPEVVAELDHRSGRKSKNPPPAPPKNGPMHRYAKTPAARRRDNKAKGKPNVCTCMNARLHDLLEPDELAIDCPTHGTTCKTCGTDHHAA